MILHLVAKVEWESKQTSQAYVPNAFTKDGFIHCTSGDLMLLRVANSYYKDTPGDFLVLGIDETKVTAPVKWEAAAPVSPPAAGHAGADAADIPPEVKAEYGESVAAGMNADSAAQPPVPSEDAGSTASPQAAAPKGEGDAVLFPHIYGPLNRDAIMGIRRMLRDTDGTFIGYAPLEEGAQGMNLKKPSELANDLVQATGDFSDALARYKDRIEGRIDELNKNIKDKLDQ